MPYLALSPISFCDFHRANYEVASGAVLVRSTPFSHCFLEELIGKGTGTLGGQQVR